MVGAPASYLKLEELSGSPFVQVITWVREWLLRGSQGLRLGVVAGRVTLGWVQIVLQSLGQLCFSQGTVGVSSDRLCTETPFAYLSLESPLVASIIASTAINSSNIGPVMSSDSTSNSRWSSWLCKHDKSHSWQGGVCTSHLGRFSLF